MKKYIKTFGILFFLFFFAKGYGQGKSTTNTELHFLVDTLSLPKEKKFISIRMATPFAYYFTFKCQCMKPNADNIGFYYSTEKKYPKAPILEKKPKYKFITWEDLKKVVIKYHRFFDDSYDLYITEVLPGNRYRTNKVSFDVISTVQ